MDENGALQELIYLTSNVMEGFTVALFLTMRDENDKIFLHAYDSFCKEINNNCFLQEGEGLIGWVYREQKTVVANNFERDTSTLQLYKKNEKIKSLIAIPLPKKIGVLYVDSKKTYSFTEEKEKILKNIVNIIYFFIKKDKFFFLEKYKNKLHRQYVEVDEIIINNELSFDKKIENIINILKYNFELYLCIFFIKNRIFFSNINILTILEGKDIISQNKFISLLMKHEKIIFRNEIKNKFCIVVNQKKYENISNYLYIPLFSDCQVNRGCLFLSKICGKHWEKDEVRFLEGLGRKIFVKMS